MLSNWRYFLPGLALLSFLAFFALIYIPASSTHRSQPRLQAHSDANKFSAHSLALGTATYHYRQVGAGPKMIFLHGFPQSWYTWRDQLEFFAKSNQVLALDLKGHGQSSRPSAVEAYRFEKILAEVVAFIENVREGQEKVVLVGHDWGGALAWEIAIGRSDLIKKLVILNSPHPQVFRQQLKTEIGQQLKSLYMLFFMAPFAKFLLELNDFNLLARLYLSNVSNQEVHQRELTFYKQLWRGQNGISGMLNYYKAMGKSKFTKEAKVSVPTLLIWGMQDKVFAPPNIKQLQAYVDELSFVPMADGSHYLLPEYSGQINRAIADFL